jgi:hypothetical protein
MIHTPNQTTHSFMEAAYLINAGYKLLGVDYRDGDTWFSFEPEEAEAVERYRSSADGRRCRNLLATYQRVRKLGLDTREIAQ